MRRLHQTKRGFLARRFSRYRWWWWFHEPIHIEHLLTDISIAYRQENHSDLFPKDPE